MTQKFVWHDLMTTDPKAAAAFYGKVIGWKIEDSGMPGPEYLMVHAGEHAVGGIMAIPEGQKDMPPCWTGYIGVDDVDVWTKKVADKGGKVHKDPQDIPGVGRFSVVADPHGAAFILFWGDSDEPPVELSMDTPGAFGWNELMAGNVDEATDWYSSLFGWTRDEAHDMDGFMYHTLKTGGVVSSVGMMNKMPDMPFPFWTYYTWVNGIDAAASRVTSNGGEILMGPHEVPGGAWIVSCCDPQGAFFNLIGSKE
ncbi:MAG: VOC family protein [Rhizobiaceae bacterium]